MRLRPRGIKILLQVGCRRFIHYFRYNNYCFFCYGFLGRRVTYTSRAVEGKLSYLTNYLSRYNKDVLRQPKAALLLTLTLVPILGFKVESLY